MIIDADAVCAAPGALLIENDAIVAAGAPETIGAPADAEVIDRPDAVILPALVNAHCHLDLTAIGPLPYGGDFVEWVGAVRRRRPADDDAIDAAVTRGIAFARAGGTGLAGDIAGAGSPVPLAVMRREGLRGVSYRELFGVGRGQAAAIRAIAAAAGEAREAAHENGVTLGLQPHAPYSCGPDVYRAAARAGRPLATHLAELAAEIEFTTRAAGPFAEFLRRLGLWDDTIAAAGVHPIDFLRDAGAGAPWLAAHVNCCERRHLDRLAASRVSVAYCPRASAYFGHEGHQYRAMLAHGVNVAIGTDSILCLDTPDRLSVLDEMRLLHRRDGTEPRTLLRMATVNGARALGVDPALVSLGPGGIGAIAVRTGAGGAGGAGEAGRDPLARMLEGDEAPEWVVRAGAMRR